MNPMKQGAQTTQPAAGVLDPLPQTLPPTYLPIDVIASGGMGVVYRAVDRLRGQVVALKQLKPGVQVDRMTIAREFRTLAALRHPYILPALDFGFDADEQPFFTMPLLETPQTILDYAAGQPFATQINLLMQVLLALMYLHRHRVIHNDLKPSNILVADGRVQMLDFGLASIVGEKYASVFGTLRYLAPERLLGGGPSAEADFFALGVTAFDIFAAPQLGAVDFKPSPDDALNLDIDVQMRNLIARLLSREPGERHLDFPHLVEVYTERSGQPLPYADLATQESFLNAAPFVGRTREREQLSAALDALHGGTGGIWLVGGESGMGKSRLLDELRVEALVKRITVVRGQVTSDLNRPYGWLEEMLRWLRLSVEVDAGDEAIIQLLLPEERAAQPQDALPSLDPDDLQRRVLDVAERLLRRAAAPLLVLVEDIHWLSAESLTALGQLAHRAANTPTLFLASYRPEYQPALAAHFAQAHGLSLERLPAGSVYGLVSAMLGAEVSPAFLAFVEAETEGNPFFIVEVMRALAEGAHGLSNVQTDEIPREVFAITRDNVLQRRLEALPEWARGLLPAAAVIGRSIDPALLARLFPNTDLQRWLATCASWYVLEAEGSGWRFAHDRIRESILAGLGADQRRDLHRQVAETLEAISTDDLSAPLLAFHWKGAENPGKEVVYAVRAGQLYLWQSSYSLSVRYLRRALELEALLPPEQRALVENLLGEALYGAGSMIEGEAHLTRALAAYNIRRNSMVSVAAQVARQGWYRAARVNGRARALAAQERQRLGLIVRACEKLGQIMYVRNQRYDSIYYALQGLNSSEYLGVGARAEQARFYGSMALAFGLLGQHFMARYYLRQADAVAKAATDPDALAWTYEVTGTYLAGCGRWDEAEARYRDSLAASRQVGNRRRQLEVTGFLAALYEQQARWESLDALSAEFERIDPHQDDPQARVWDIVTRGTMRLLRGEAEAAFDWATEAETLVAQVEDIATRIRGWGFLTLYYLHFDLPDAARQYADPLLDALTTTSPVAFPTLDAYVACAAFYLRAFSLNPTRDAQAQAARACRAMDAYGRAFDIGRPYALAFGGWLAHLQGAHGKALRLAERAHGLAERLNLPGADALAVALLLRDPRRELLAVRAEMLRVDTEIRIELLLPTAPNTGD